MKRISALTLVILLIFMGCAKQNPQQQATTTHEQSDSITISTAEVVTEEITEESLTARTDTNTTIESVTTSATTVTQTTKPLTTRATTALQTSTTQKATTQTTKSATHTTQPTAAKNTAAYTAATTQADTTTNKAEILVTVQTTKPVQAATDEALITVTVLCSCKNAVDYGIREKNPAIPESGIILNTTVTVKQSSTAMDAIKAACSKNSVEIAETRGYIKSIGTLAEKDCGGASGWLYSVNSAFPNTSSDKYVLTDGDSIELHYTVKNGDITRM